jgi:hypothetical protein
MRRDSMRNLSTFILVFLCLAIWGCPKDDGYLAPWPQNTVETKDYDESGDSGALRQKAEAYDAWHLKWHQRDYGGSAEVLFKDDSLTEVERIGGWGDSTIWTGTYLASQSMRYHVTGNTQAKTNAMRMVRTLSGHLHATGTPGYIARYWAPKTSIAYYGDEWCDTQERCHHMEEGPFAGDWWWGETSRDQYTGWFLGMSLAYDLVDDEETRAIIKADVGEVVGKLIEHQWKIIAEDGEPSSGAAEVLPGMRLAFCTIGYHVTGDAAVGRELSKMLLNANRAAIRISDINFMNRYTEYYGNNLGHNCWYNTLRLGKAYFSEDDYKWLVKEFNENVHTFTRLSHNAWFNGIYMSQGGWKDDPKVEYYNQLVHDLIDFWDVPNREHVLPARELYDIKIDPMSVIIHNIYTEQPWMKEIMGEVEVQAIEAFPVQLQCTSGFLWQRNPFRIDACGSDLPRAIHPGVDYLVAYWLASYHKFLTKDM